MKFSEIDIVKTTISFPDEGIEKGESGTIVATFTMPSEAYLVEFVNYDGTTRAMLTILAEYLEKA